MADSDLRQDQPIELVIDGFAAGGFGVGRAEGRAVFVPETLPGERILAKITHIGGKKVSARAVSIRESSPDRADPPCPVFGLCGGCQLMHAAYPAQLTLKRIILMDALRSIAGIDLSPDFEVIPAPDPLGCRNRGQYPAAREGKKVVTGFFAPRSHRVVPVEQCLLHDEWVDRAVAQVRAWANRKRIPVYDEKRHRGWLRHVAVRASRTTGQVLVTLVGREERRVETGDLVRRLRRSQREVAGVVLNLNPGRTNVIFGKHNRSLWGQDWLDETLLGLHFRLAPEAFFQVNTRQAENLFGKVRDFLEGHPGMVVDGYCGVGVLALILAREGHPVTGIEMMEAAVQGARRAAEVNRIEGTKFHEGRVEKVLPRLVDSGLRPGAIVLDPPRKGCAEEVLEAVDASGASKLAYVSCHPGTLARDLSRLFERGFQLDRLTAVDMFPQTAHLEVFAGLVR
jgi:23S rRNA (uracil1939-C5)-methyltransferase